MFAGLIRWRQRPRLLRAAGACALLALTCVTQSGRVCRLLLRRPGVGGLLLDLHRLLWVIHGVAAFPASPYPGLGASSPEAQCMAVGVWSALMLPLLLLGVLAELEVFGSEAGTPPPGALRSRSSSPQRLQPEADSESAPQQEARRRGRSSLRLRQLRSSEGERAGGGGGGGGSVCLEAVAEESEEAAAPVASGSRAGAAGERDDASAERAAGLDALPAGTAARDDDEVAAGSPFFRFLVRPYLTSCLIWSLASLALLPLAASHHSADAGGG